MNSTNYLSAAGGGRAANYDARLTEPAEVPVDLDAKGTQRAANLVNCMSQEFL